MKLISNNSKPWNIPKNLEQAFSTKKLEELLYAINTIGNHNYFIMDFYAQRAIHTGFHHVTGYSKDIIERENEEFYFRIFPTKEIERMHQIHNANVKILDKYPINRRKDLYAIVNQIAYTSIGERIIVQDKAIPYQLDKNGNLWLALCCNTIAPSFSEESVAKAAVVDSKTGDRWVFAGGKLELTTSKILTDEERKILKWQTDDLTAEQISEYLSISVDSLKRKKRKIYDKLNVATSDAAISKAAQMGLI
jgi:DNA-binding CsgD family transcriptional regulator